MMAKSLATKMRMMIVRVILNLLAKRRMMKVKRRMKAKRSDEEEGDC